MFKIAEANIMCQGYNGKYVAKRFFPLTDDEDNKKVCEKDYSYKVLKDCKWFPESFSPINIRCSYETYDSALNAIEEYKTKITEKLQLGIVKIYDIE